MLKFVKWFCCCLDLFKNEEEAEESEDTEETTVYFNL